MKFECPLMTTTLPSQGSGTRSPTEFPEAVKTRQTLFANCIVDTSKELFTVSEHYVQSSSGSPCRSHALVAADEETDLSTQAQAIHTEAITLATFEIHLSTDSALRAQGLRLTGPTTAWGRYCFSVWVEFSPCESRPSRRSRLVLYSWLGFGRPSRLLSDGLPVLWSCDRIGKSIGIDVQIVRGLEN